MPKVKHISSVSSSTLVSDAPYGPSWNGVTDVAPSKKAVYDKIQTIGLLGGIIAYVDPIGGNDSTAVLGNLLAPYLTIGAAISALGSTSNSTLYLYPGAHYLFDSNTPYGLKAPNTNYKIVCEQGVTIESYCSYGVYIFNGATDSGTTGAIIGYPPLLFW